MIPPVKYFYVQDEATQRENAAILSWLPVSAILWGLLSVAAIAIGCVYAIKGSFLPAAGAAVAVVLFAACHFTISRVLRWLIRN